MYGQIRPSDSSFHLVVGWEWLAQMDPHCKAILLGGMFLTHLGLQLETLLLIKAVQRSEGKWFFSQETLQSRTPALQHCAAQLRGDMRWSPEDLRGQNLEATVVQDAVLQRELASRHLKVQFAQVIDPDVVPAGARV